MWEGRSLTFRVQPASNVGHATATRGAAHRGARHAACQHASTALVAPPSYASKGMQARKHTFPGPFRLGSGFGTMYYLMEGYIGVNDQIMFGCRAQFVGSRVALWIQRCSAVNVISQIVLPHLLRRQTRCKHLSKSCVQAWTD